MNAVHENGSHAAEEVIDPPAPEVKPNRHQRRAQAKQAPPAAPTTQIDAAYLAEQIAIAEAIANQMLAQVTATELYQRWQQQSGKLQSLRELLTYVETQTPPA